MEIIELQAGQASEPDDHWSYAWRVATGQESVSPGWISTRRRSSRFSASPWPGSRGFLRCRRWSSAAARVCRRPTTTRGT